MRVYVKGFGCSASLADSEVVAGCLAAAGHVLVGSVAEAAVVVYVTCAVKAPTENRMISLLRQVPRDKKLVVAGCLPLINPARLRREVRVDGVVGPAAGQAVVDVVAQVAQGRRVVDGAVGAAGGGLPALGLPRVRVNPWVSIVPVSYGCLGACAYCCVRLARGRLRSYGVAEVVARVAADVAAGVREVWLTGQDVACYGADVGSSLGELIGRVCAVPGDFRVRVGMMTPNHLAGEVEGVVAAYRRAKVFKFLHVPVQSGDDAVLARMRRGHGVAEFEGVVARFRQAFPRVTVATDVIVGFPGETEEAFRRSVGLVERVQPDVTNVSKYFARPGAPAAGLGAPVAAGVVKTRSRRLAATARRVSLACNQRWVGWTGQVLVDEAGTGESVVGRNFAYKPVVVPGGPALLGKFVAVRVVGAFQSHVLGEIP